MQKKLEREYQTPEEIPQGTPFEVTNEGIPDTHLKTRSESHIREAPTRIQRTREASREEAIASTRQFFAAVDERNRNNATRRPIGMSSEVCERDDTEVPDVSTSVVATTPVVFDVEPVDTSSPRVTLPNGSLPQPIATTTCRPRTWMQQITEGQINEPVREEGSNDSNPSEVYVLPQRNS